MRDREDFGHILRVHLCPLYPSAHLMINPQTGTVELIKEWPQGVVPKLKEAAGLVRDETNRRGYAVLNDRYITQRL